MMQITYENFNHRTRCLNYIPVTNSDVTYNGLAVIDEANSLYIESNAIVKIQNWRTLHTNTNMAFLEAVDALIDMMLYSDNLSKVKTQYQYLREETYKVKDAAQLKASLKRKFSNMRNMSTEKGEMKKKLRTPLQAKVDPTGKKQMAALSTPGVALQHTQSPPKPEPVIGLASRREAVIEECCNGLYEEACVIYDCDRIMNNARLIYEQFQIDTIFNEYALNQRDLYDAVYSTTACISSILPFDMAYTTALETCWYTLSRKHLPYTMDAIIEAITDYFIFNSGLDSDKACFILENSPLLEDNSHIHIRYLSKTHKAHDSDKTKRPENAQSRFRVRRIGKKSFSEADLADDLASNVIQRSDNTTLDDIVCTPVNRELEQEKRIDIHDLIKDFKKSCNADTGSSDTDFIFFKSLIDQIIKICPGQIPSEFANLLALIRMNFIFYGKSKNVNIPNDIIKIIQKLFSVMKKTNISEEQMTKMRDAIDNEIRYIQCKISKVKDSEYYESYTSYLEALKGLKEKYDLDSDDDDSTSEDDTTIEDSIDNLDEGEI